MKRLRYSVVKWLVVALICLLLGFLLGKFKQDILEEQLSVMTLDLQTMKIRNGRLETDLSRLQVTSISEQQTIKSLIQGHKQLYDELAIVNNKLFFYQDVIAPELETMGVKVHSFQLTQSGKSEGWNYELVLMQSQKGRRFLNGKIDISLSIFEDDKLKQVKLSDLTEEQENGFRFKYFQTIQGSFSLPAEITVDEVIVKLSVAGSRRYKEQNLEERYDWRVLTTKDIGDLSEFDNSESSKVAIE
ncbi:MAG: hypothetical protein GY951_03395 [Psychromonas sp.]|nr:hypothetical protein [Alteromonadales bacterium]MCP5077084.1 hypothetical protein [Psychromonas sp.]